MSGASLTNRNSSCPRRSSVLSKGPTCINEDSTATGRKASALKVPIQHPHPTSSLPLLITTYFHFNLFVLLSIHLISHLTGSRCSSPPPPLFPSAFWPPPSSWLATQPSSVPLVMPAVRVPPSVVRLDPSPLPTPSLETTILSSLPPFATHDLTSSS